MNAKHYLTHLVLQHELTSKRVPEARDAVTKQFRETLSAEHVTAALKERLLRKRKREAALQELNSIASELTRFESDNPRIIALKNKVKELQMRAGLIGPLP